MIDCSSSTLAIWLLTFYYRYSLRTSSPIYGWWYFVMLYECVGKTLGQVLPKFPPSTDDEVESLLAINIRVYVLILLILLFYLLCYKNILSTYLTYLTCLTFLTFLNFINFLNFFNYQI